MLQRMSASSTRRDASLPKKPKYEVLRPLTSYKPSIDDIDNCRLALALAKVAHDTKGEGVRVLHVAPLVNWTCYMVFVSVFSRPQLNAMLLKMETEADALGCALAHGQEVGRTTWELLDFGDVVVNVMTAEQREFYDLETHYGAAKEVPLPFVHDGGDGGDGSPDWQKRLPR